MDRDVFRCATCGHIVVPAGVARRADGISIYESTDSIFKADGNADYYFDETNAEAAGAKVAYVARYCSRGTRLLDVGASYGHFLSEARQEYNTSGIEVSPSAVDWGRARFGVNLSVGSVYDLGAPGSYGAVTCWDVIEHLEDPAGAVDEIRRCLAPSGLLFLSTPDAGSLVATLMGSRWHYIDPVQHLNLFTRANLIRLLTARGFSIVNHRHFGRSYRVRYIVNRWVYLRRGPDSGPPVPASTSWLMNLAVPIKLWDVVGIAARRTS